MIIDGLTIKKMFVSGCESMINGKEELTNIDSTFGDGDHGVTMEKISKVMIKKLNNLENNMDLHDFFDDLGSEVMGVNGGSAGPLWGTFISGMALGINEGVKEVKVEDVKNMFKYALEELCDITTARIGDKTMMDSLIPAVNSMQKANGTLEEVMKAAMDAAQEGAKASENFISKFGRAKSYKEKTIGTQDAGAVSMKYFFKGLYEGLDRESCK
ncbi:MAG: dihydroxyacetone kinase subunit L [Terrisporobacter sp.]